MEENPEEVKCVAQHQEVCKDNSTMETIGSLEPAYHLRALPTDEETEPG
jgi:hypothetical protein